MRLALADDHQMFLDALGAGLAQRGYDVVAACDHLDGLVDLVEARQPELCLFDVDFGGESVIASAEAIRERHPGIAVLLLTATAGPEVWSAYERHTVDGVVSKLCEMSTVVRAIERVRKGERVVERFSRPSRRASSGSLTTPLSDRERDVLELLMRGASTEEMSVELEISTHTVRTHVQSVLRKLGVNTRAKAASMGATADKAEKSLGAAR